MLSFIGIYIMLFGMSLISILLLRKDRYGKNIIISFAGYYIIYFYFVCFFRTLVGNGARFLSSSFADKTTRAYVKVGVLCVVVLIVLSVFLNITKELGQKFLDYVLGIFSTLCLLYTVLIDLPRMKIVVVFGIVSLVIGAILLLLKTKNKIIWLFKEEKSRKDRYVELSSSILFFCSLFFLTGPTELYVYNADDFVFVFKDFIPYMFLYIVILLLTLTPLVVECLPDIVVVITRIIIFLYCICSYVQQMFLNGHMWKLEGNEQNWGIFTIVGNLLIWIVLSSFLLFLLQNIKKGSRVITYGAFFISAVQIVTFIILFFTNNTLSLKSEQLVENRKFELASGDNVVIFILDAYDTQMLDLVLEEDENYLNPLHDFIFYNNMTSRYVATDGSLPYLLTGRVAEDETEYLDIYRKSTFLKDIKSRGYEINILTTAYYIEPFEEQVVDNFTEDYYCLLDFEKTVSQMSNCVRYRSTPFVLKPRYYYENYDLTNVIYDTNVYLFGTDAKFYDDLCNNGIHVDDTKRHMMHVYHLYGAHAPYYLTEDALLNYNSNPIAQWKGCLKIVYDYLEQLKKNNLYDSTSVIIMADHGLNRSQRTAMDMWNIEVTEESNPIFFVKKKNQNQDELVIDEHAVSHDNFFATVMGVIGDDSEKYGKAVWD